MRFWWCWKGWTIVLCSNEIVRWATSLVWQFQLELQAAVVPLKPFRWWIHSPRHFLGLRHSLSVVYRKKGLKEDIYPMLDTQCNAYVPSAMISKAPPAAPVPCCHFKAIPADSSSLHWAGFLWRHQGHFDAYCKCDISSTFLLKIEYFEERIRKVWKAFDLQMGTILVSVVSFMPRSISCWSDFS